MSLKDYYYPHEYKALVRLGLPITVGQIGMTLQGVADTIMVGRHATTELAAAGFVNNIFNLAILISFGFTMGSISQIGAYYAQQRQRDMVAVLKSGLASDLLQCLGVMVAMVVFYVALPYMGQPQELLPLMRPYYLVLLASLPFVSIGGGYKQFFDSKGDTWVAMVITLIGNVWNIVFNALLIFGLCGFPELGLLGAGIATLSSRVAMALLYVAAYFFMPRYAAYRDLWHQEHIHRRYVGLLNRLGWPIAVQQGLEAASFSLCAILLGWIGTTALAAHQVMMNVAMIIFLFYIGIGSAVSIRVSNYHGVADRTGIYHATYAGHQLIFLVGAVMCTLVCLFRRDIAGVFTDSQEVADVVASMVLPVVLYQVGDGMQCNYVNALRGLGDVKPLMRYSFIAYIVISLPLSYLFGNVMGGGAMGVWMGFPFGLTTAALLFCRRFHKVLRRY
jgi:MATE family multidrug resistance protein